MNIRNDIDRLLRQHQNDGALTGKARFEALLKFQSALSFHCGPKAAVEDVDPDVYAKAWAQYRARFQSLLDPQRKEVLA